MDEYWFGDPSLLYNYQSAFELRKNYDLQMSWTQGAYFKSALGSTQLWTVQPLTEMEWKKMPKYAENPIKDLETEQISINKEKQELLEKTKEKLKLYGLLEKQ